MSQGRPRKRLTNNSNVIALIVLATGGLALCSSIATAEDPGTSALVEWPFDAKEAKRRQQTTAKDRSVPVLLDKQLTKGLKLGFVLVPPGRFLMGDTFADELQLQARIKEPFYISKWEVTQAQWQAVMGENPSKVKGASLPVHNVSWNDCQQFVRKLNEKFAATKSERFELPTGVQWEYACRAGSSALWYFGEGYDAFERMDKNLPYQLNSYGWSSENSGSKLHPVGRKRPNAFGLYDTHGNVWEWCNEEKKGPRGTFYSFRGGAWDDSPEVCRSAMRGFNSATTAGEMVGFRIVRTVTLNDAIAVPKETARVWTDSTGKFRMKAEYLGLEGDKVRLKKSDGTIIVVPLEKLSKAGNQFIKARSGTKN